MATEQHRHDSARRGTGIADQVAQTAIATLKRQRFGMSGIGPDSLSLWQEFALQVQGDHSAFWGAYEAHVREVIEGAVVALDEADRRALALRTPEGRGWSERDVAERDADPPHCLDSMTALVYGRVFRAAMDLDDEQVAEMQCQPRGRGDDGAAVTGEADRW